jgi:vancomycin resistance protein YoaR
VGRLVDVEATLALVSKQVLSLQDGVVPIVVKETEPVILDATAQAEKARKILSQSLTLTLPEGESGAGPWVFDPPTLSAMLSIERKQDGERGEYEVGLNTGMLISYLSNLAPELQRYPQNARFIFNDETGQLDVKDASVRGRAVDVEATIKAIRESLDKDQHNVSLVFQYQDPQVPDTKTGADLGITELVQASTTYFYGSSNDRVTNIRTAASRFHGLLVAPGETFSMANALGDISLENGYAEALIIVGDQTVQGVGGGVCQVSTTLFRAAFFAGFPIVERHSHAYRVSYYEKEANNQRNDRWAGMDATVFVPIVDFKFVNDTPYWLLMETYVTDNAITWKMYSTKDGRTVDWHTTGPINVIEPPEPLYKENPALSQGEMKQVDWAAQGSDITVDRTVYRDGAVYLSDVFHTNYQPWRAIYEYGPGTELPTPEAEGE